MEKIYRVQLNSKGAPNFSTAVEAEPKQADDLISRADAIKAVNTALFPKINTAKDAEKAIEAIPSAQPKQGEWIKRTHDTLIAQVNFAYCSECGQPIMHEHTRSLWNYCPHCGARMQTERSE